MENLIVCGSNKATRRGFLKSASLTAGLAAWAGGRSATGTAPSIEPRGRDDRLPREVWIASVSQNGMEAKSPEAMTRAMLARMKELVRFEPDIICLPEVFPRANISGPIPAMPDMAEQPIGPVSEPLAEFAREHHCYVVCPIHTKQDGRYYNSAVFIDRAGKLVGEYRKIHPTIGEMQGGTAPGPLTPPVFQTDFGMVGAQICFDIEWSDGWANLRKAGAEIVFWPSAFGGGKLVNTKAWENKYCVVSSTRKDTSKICDVSGQELARTGRWNHWVCAPVNLEKVFLHTWPVCRRFKEIHAKYGRKVRITTFAEEEHSIIESRSADVKIADVVKEFELVSYEDYIQAAEREQNTRRS